VWDASSGNCLQVYQGLGDTHAIAVGTEKFPFIALERVLETAIQLADTQRSLAWLEEAINGIATHPSGRAWAGSVNRRLCLFALEGDARTTSSTASSAGS
jgi:hypothetical protein